MRIFHIRFPGSRRLHKFDAGDLEIAVNDVLIVEGDRGPRLGSAVDEPVETEWDVKQPLSKVTRKATDGDLKKSQANKLRETQASEICLQAVHEQGLPIKLVKAEYIFDGSKVIFYFTAEGRVDFRELVRVLAHRLRTRIEMYQIGVRDEAKILGGLGICGREFCCASFLTAFSPVAIRMAKDQGVSLNPAKVSGGCGRLLCCLAYEHEEYADFREGLPKIGKRAMTPEGVGRISRYDIIKRKVYVLIEGGGEKEFDRDQIQKYRAPDNLPTS